jgi:hypothetical protein
MFCDCRARDFGCREACLKWYHPADFELVAQRLGGRPTRSLVECLRLSIGGGGRFSSVAKEAKLAEHFAGEYAYNMFTISNLEAEVGIEREQPFRLLRYYHPATRGAQPHNSRTPVKSGVSARMSSTRQYRWNTHPPLANNSFNTRSLALLESRKCKFTSDK